MPRLLLKDIRSVGLDFIEFLEESNRRSITDKTQLKDIYNIEFRNRDGSRDPQFSRVLFALSRNGKARIYDGHVYFNPKVRQICHDQWRSSRRPSHGGLPVQNEVQGSANGVSVPSIGSLETCPGPGHNGTSPSGEESRVRARRRMANLLLKKLTSDGTSFVSDKGGVRITSDHDQMEGKIHFCVEGAQEYVVRLFVENLGSSPVYFIYYSALHFISYFTLEDQSKVTRSNPLYLVAGERYEVRVRFRSRIVGCYPATLAFEFKADLQPLSQAFHIVRFLEARFQTSLSRELAPTSPYMPRSIMALNTEPYSVEDGVPPDSVAVQRLVAVVRLKDYKVPPYMTQLIRFLNGSSSISFRPELLEAKAMLESPLSWGNYSARFQLLLFLEELQMEVDIKKYNMKGVPMFRDQNNKKLLVLEVPGVSENRPSVLRGDQLLVRVSRLAETEDGAREEVVKYRGYVHRVELEKVKLGFSHKLWDRIFQDNMKFDVEFIVNRLTMRIQQRAAELASQYRLEDVLFPTVATASSQQVSLPSLSLFDRQLEQNPEQYKAVQSIIAGSSRPAPYLVFGPPGTGKTVTLVEAIKQVEKTQSSSHILACAPSNSAADLLCRKVLQHVEGRKVFRMYASSRNPEDVPQEIQSCCNLDPNGETFVFPSRDELKEYKVIVTTLLTAGRLVTGGIPQGHFTHIFIDEAGHAVETECIIPLAGLLMPRSCQVVLAGDPKQLGPILRSPLVLKSGMGMSLLERLMTDVSVYQKDTTGSFNSHFVTKLLRNYRSHPAILKIPNQLFYDGELQVFANEILRNSYCRWEYLPMMDFPVIFHGVAGRDEREANSPSFFNTAEVVELMEYLKKLFQSQGKKGVATIAPKDIGIIAPYRKQVEKIRQALRALEKDLKITTMRKDLKVGSVEEFQGQERKVILVSTVRSSCNYLQLDRKFSLGFIKNEKRFNVAITRAKALLIVVGNPVVLNTDPTWGRFIQYCEDGGGESGFRRSDAEGDEDVVARLSALQIHVEPEVETDESLVQRQFEPEWRNEQ